MAHSHAHQGEDRSSYYLDQLFMIGVSGALAAVTIMLFQSGSLSTLVHQKFALAVGAGGVCLMGLVVLRAIAVWLSVDSTAAKEDHSHCEHAHGEEKEQGHSHSHAHSHSHSPGHSHNGDDGHDHGWAPWRYVVLLLPVVLYFLVLWNPSFSREPFDKPVDPVERIQNFILIFRSILWEALPFIILGSLIAGILEEFLPQRVITAVIPKNPVLAVMLGGLLGLVFPMCECGIIPIMRRLLRKGLPLSCCIAYLLAGPIINVIVLLSTVAAFSGMENVFVGGEPSYQMGSLWMTGFRAGLGYLVAVVTGLIVDWQHRKHGDALLTPLARMAEKEQDTSIKKSWWERISNVTETALHDFVDITVFLILGALLSATVRLFVGPEEIAALGSDHAILAIILMMGLAIALCLCSEADAFVAASFVTLRPSAKLAFLVLGPMLDFKLYAMYTRIFRPRLIFTIYTSVLLQVFVYSLIVHYFWEANARYLINPKQSGDAQLSEAEREQERLVEAAKEGAAALCVLPQAWQSAAAPMSSFLSAGVSASILASRQNATPPEMSFLRFEGLGRNAELRSYFNGRVVRMTGRFRGNEQTFQLLRYKMNCCAADATPLRAIFFVDPAAKQTLNVGKYNNQWVQVTGHVMFTERGDPMLMLTPTPQMPLDELVKIVPVDPNPYVY